MSKTPVNKSCVKAEEDLRERVKELSCLYGVARLAARTDMEIDQILNGITECLPPAWLYPEKVCARIVFDGRSYSTSNYRRGPQRQHTSILIGGKRRGYIEVIYPDGNGPMSTNPFLPEEQHLLDAVGREVAAIIMQREADREKLRLEEHLRHADRLATIGELAAGVAHELNEPLAHILGFAQLVQKCPDLPAPAQADIGKISATALHARDIVKKLLIFARQVEPQKTRVNLNDIVKEGIAFFESRCISEGIVVVCTYAPDLPDIDADPSQLKQVLINVVVNALHAMPSGGRLIVSTYRKSGKVCLTIADTGAGMDKDVLKKIFTPFFTTKDVGLGTGLGLPVAHGIIMSHGGSIKVESSPGKGTLCRIEMPLKKVNPF